MTTISLTKNFAGVIEALKIKSGSTKFYKPNYEGVIQAILDWSGGIDIIYPPNIPPDSGTDGDMIGFPNTDGDWFIYIWADGAWQPIHVLTTDVIPNPPGGMPGRSGGGGPIYTPEGEELTNQQDINWYLYNHLNGGEQMVFYGEKPPEKPAPGSIFTQEDTLTQYVYDDGQWVQTSFCPSSGDGGTTEKPWVRIEEVIIDREWWATTNSANEYAAKVKLADIHYNDTYPSDLTYEWEFDEKGDGNWQPWDLKADLNVDDHYLAQFKWFIFLWAPEHRGSESGMDPAHAFPCSKGRVRITNTWQDGTFEKSEWYEFWLGKAASPSAGYEHKAPAVCINP